MRPRIVCSGDWPPETRRVVEHLVTYWAWLLPAWLEQLNVSHDGAIDEAATMQTHYRYRTANLTIGRFMENDAHERSNCIVHELLHVHTMLIFGHAESYLTDALAGDANRLARETVLEELGERHESMTCDLARVILAKVAPPASVIQAMIPERGVSQVTRNLIEDMAMATMRAPSSDSTESAIPASYTDERLEAMAGPGSSATRIRRNAEDFLGELEKP